MLKKVAVITVVMMVMAAVSGFAAEKVIGKATIPAGIAMRGIAMKKLCTPDNRCAYIVVEIGGTLAKEKTLYILKRVNPENGYSAGYIVDGSELIGQDLDGAIYKFESIALFLSDWLVKKEHITIELFKEGGAE